MAQFAFQRSLSCKVPYYEYRKIGISFCTGDKGTVGISQDFDIGGSSHSGSSRNSNTSRMEVVVVVRVAVATDSAEQPRKPRPVKQEVRATVTGLPQKAGSRGGCSMKSTFVNEGKSWGDTN